MLDLKDDYGDLHGFYATQRPAWERLLKTQSEFGPNASDFERDPVAAEAWRQMKTILSAPAPYGLLKDSDTLIATVKAVNDERLEARRKQALKILKARHEQTFADVQKLGVPHAENQIMTPLANLLKQAETETILGNLAKAEQDVVTLAHEALEQATKLQVAEKKPDAIKLKPTRTVQAATLLKKVYLETTEDVADYVSALKSELDDAIQKGERVEIQ